MTKIKLRHGQRKRVSHARLLEILSYHPESGIFRWKIRKGPPRIDSVAGTRTPKGHVVITIDKRLYLAHHLAWFYVYKTWPVGEVDHKDTVPYNNAIDNLREATRGQNAANTNVRTDNTTGYKGVSRKAGSIGYQAKITVNKKQIHLGYFRTPEEAHEAYSEAARTHFKEFARVA